MLHAFRIQSDRNSLMIFFLMLTSYVEIKSPVQRIVVFFLSGKK